jgi:hypothetical protein
MPAELFAALLAAGEVAQGNWAAAPPELQMVYINYVGGPHRRRIRRERAADTALTAGLGILREHANDRSLSWWDVFWSYIPI